MLNTVQSAENHVMSELEVKSGFVDLFEVDSSQSQDDPLTPPPQCRKKKLKERHEVDNKDDTRMTKEAEASKAGDTRWQQKRWREAQE
jgi:hypothetical protein